MPASKCAAVIRALQRHGLLLQQDKTMPSVVGMITGEPLSGSWWNHAKGQEIFACLDRLLDRDDVLMTRLIARKVTYVHRALWPALFAIGTSGQDWQIRGLSPPARALLKRMETSGRVEATGAAARQLQERILVAAVEVHTAEGKHAMALQPWSAVMGGVKKIDVARARRQIEDATTALGGEVRMLPWD